MENLQEDVKVQDNIQKKILMAKAKQQGYKNISQYVNFRVYNYYFLIEIKTIQEIIKPMTVTRLINVPDYIRGVLNLRGNVIPVISLRMKFHIEQKEMDANSRIIIIKYKKKMIGFIVDNVTQVRYINKDDIKSLSSITGDYEKYAAKEAIEIDNKINMIIDYKSIIQSSGI